MTALKHPLTGAVYTLRDDGLVDVDNNGLTGVFHFSTTRSSWRITRKRKSAISTTC